jgi:hypothetical protein
MYRRSFPVKQRPERRRMHEMHPSCTILLDLLLFRCVLPSVAR